MDALFHFLFILLVLLAARVHLKHHFLAPLAFAMITLVPDIDHFFGMVPRVTLHNVFFTVLFPLILLGLAFAFEKKGVFWKQFFLILLVVLAVHPVLDLPTEPAVQYFWPVSDAGVTLKDVYYAPVILGEEAYLVSPLSISLIISILIMLPVLFLGRTIDFMAGRKEPAGKAAKDTIAELRYRIKYP